MAKLPISRVKVKVEVAKNPSISLLRYPILWTHTHIHTSMRRHTRIDVMRCPQKQKLVRTHFAVGRSCMTKPGYNLGNSRFKFSNHVDILTMVTSGCQTSASSTLVKTMPRRSCKKNRQTRNKKKMTTMAEETAQ